MYRKCIGFFVIAVMMLSCSNHDQEDVEAKQMLQGIWVNDEQGSPAFMAQGDSIFYPDSTSQPVSFWVSEDSLYLQGSRLCRYKITKQAEHLFQFINQSGDEVKLVKAQDKGFLQQFKQYQPYALNLFTTFDSDTIVHDSGVTYDCRIHVEPTSERIVKALYNNEGIEVENIYLDQAVSLTILKDQKKILEQTTLKNDFAALVPKEQFNRYILRSINYSYHDTEAIYLDAIIGIPDAASSYVVEMKVSDDGKITKRVK